MLLSTFLLFANITFFLYWILKSNKKRNDQAKCASKIRGPPIFPIIGHGYLAFGGTRKLFENLCKITVEYKPICKLWLGKWAFILTKPEDVQTVLSKCLEKEDNYKYIIPVFGDGFITKPVQDWKKLRKPIVSTFNQHILNSFVSIFNNYSKELTVKLEEKSDYIDIFPVVAQCSIDMICNSLMGSKMNAMKEESKLFAWTTRLSEISLIRMFTFYLWPDFIWRMTKIGKETSKLDKNVHNYIKEVVTKRKETFQKSGKQQIFLDYLLELTDVQQKWSDDDLINNTRNVIMAGSDALALTVCYSLTMLAMFPDVQENAYNEVCETKEIKAESLQKMEYLERVIKETLRLFPVVPLIGRNINEDVSLGEYILPKGSSVGVSIFCIHRDEEYWPNPLKFDPNRFLPEEIKKRHPCTYLPFSYGPRNCIGFNFAIMVIKVILSHVLTKFKIVETKYQSISDIKCKMDVAIKCCDGFPIKLVSRE